MQTEENKQINIDEIVKSLEQLSEEERKRLLSEIEIIEKDYQKDLDDISDEVKELLGDLKYSQA